MAVRYGLWLILAWVAGAAAVTYTPAMHEAEWRVDTSIFECRMTHSVPFYGDAIFARRAGEAQQFYLHPKVSRLKSGKALLESQSPLWKPGGGNKSLGYVAVVQGARPITLDQRLSQQMLAELLQGMQLVFTRRPWYGADESAQVALSSISFRPAYRRYLDCLAGLLPVNYDQVARTAIYFPSGGHELKPSELRKLDNIVLYVKADPSVVAYVVDGHTDSMGTRTDNLELSKRRAETVTEYLTSHGIDLQKITTRWHGERYPTATNRTREGRAQNRRVTIRLDRAEVPEVPPLARSP